MTYSSYFILPQKIRTWPQHIFKDYKNKKTIIPEFKFTEDKDRQEEGAESAAGQIIAKRYADIFNSDYKEVYEIGIGFYKKSCHIVSANPAGALYLRR